MTATRRLGDSATRAVLSGLIDYAGLFPPAGLAMPEAVANFAAHQRRDDHWALGRFVVPANRLSEFEAAYGALSAEDLLGTRWPLTVLLGADAGADMQRVVEFVERHPHGGPQVLSLEAKALSPAAVPEIRSAVQERYELYLELPLTGDLAPLGAAVKSAGARAKIRTGGIRAEEIPGPDAVLKFLEVCANLRLPFKATAGLHHPIRGVAPLTYVPGCDSAVMYGYLNVLAAAAACWHSRTREAREWLLADDRQVLRLDEGGLHWRTQQLSPVELAVTRREFMRSIGSCSFTEPLDEIRSLPAMVSA